MIFCILFIGNYIIINLTFTKRLREMGTLESMNKENRDFMNIQEPTHLLKKNSSSLHILQPKPIQKIADYIQRKWKFQTKEDAQNKYKRLLNKLAPSERVITVKNVQIFGLQKPIHKNLSEFFMVKAKIQYPRNSLFEEMKQRKKNNLKFPEKQIINILLSICEGLKELSTKNLYYVPSSLSQIFYNKKKIKLRDPELISSLKTTNKESFQMNKSKKLCVLIMSVGLMEEFDQIAFQEIVKFNLQFSTSLSALMLKMSQGCLSIEEIQDHTLKIKAQKILQEQNLRSFKNGFCLRKNSQSMIPKQNNWCITEIKNQGSSTERKYFCKSASENNLGDRLISHESKRNIIKELFDEKQNTQKSLNIDSENTFLQKSESDVILVRKTHNSTKTSIEIDEHQFPKTIKPFRKSNLSSERNSAKQSLVDEDQKAKKQLLNAEFLKLTNGTQFNLHKKNQEVLESVGEEDESMLIKDDKKFNILNSSPVINLETEGDELPKEQKEEEIFEIKEQAREQHSEIEYQNRYNSTIMEVSDEDESYHQHHHANEDSRKQQRHSIDIDKYSIISIKSQNLHNEDSSASKLSFQNNEEEDNHCNQFVVEQYEGGSKYEGYTKNGLKHGFGKLYYEDGGSYEGAWIQGEIEGFGKLYYQSGSLAYEGYWKKGEFDGQGMIINEMPEPLNENFNYTNLEQIGASWVLYEGNFQQDQKCGFGTLQLIDGSKYIGTWLDNEIQGDGVFVTKEGEQITGKWQSNILMQFYQKEENNN